MAPPPPHVNMAQRMYFMANKETQETTVKSRKQIAEFFIVKSGAGKFEFLIMFRYSFAPWRLSRLAISIFPLAMAMCSGPRPSKPFAFTLAP